MAYDWNKIKTEYATGTASQRELAEKHGISPSALMRQARLYKWVDARKDYRSKVVAKTVAKASTREANRLAKLMEATTRAVEVATAAINDPQQFNRYIVERRERYASPEIEEDEDGTAHAISERQWSEEQVFNKTDTKALKDLTAVLKDLTGLMRDLYNIPTLAQEQAHQIAAERLELDKKKAEAGDNTASGIEVVFSSAGPEEWNE